MKHFLADLKCRNVLHFDEKVVMFGLRLLYYGLVITMWVYYIFKFVSVFVVSLIF